MKIGKIANGAEYRMYDNFPNLKQNLNSNL